MDTDSKLPSNAPQQQQPPIRKRLQPSEKQLKQQHHHHQQPQRQRSFQTQTIMAGLYDLEETLGKGHFATVKAAKHVFTGERVAVKVIDKTKLDTVSQKALLKEVLCMKLVQHPNVVRLYEVIDTSTKLYLVLELGQGDLYDLILRQQGGLPEPEARVYFKQILKAVSYCHKLHVAHRDLKPENVVYFPPPPQSKTGTGTAPLINNAHHSNRITTTPNAIATTTPTLGQLKLTDFGFSNKFCPGVKLDTSCGSLAYSAPEILLGDSYDAPAVDIWSLGVILYMLVAGRAPFQEANDSETLTMIMDVKYSIPDNLSSELVDLIRRMLVRDPRRRARLREIEAHRWVAMGNGGSQEQRSRSQEEVEEIEEEEEEQFDDALPLIASNTLTDGESERIISEMVKGGIVSCVEDVKTSLTTNAYNHITSTYYLLAERFLREKTKRRPSFIIRQPSLSSSSSSPHHHNTSSPSPSPSLSNQPAASSQSQLSPPPSPPITIHRKNSHQFEDIVLPSQQQLNNQQQQHHHHHQQNTSVYSPHLTINTSSSSLQTKSIAGLDLETTSMTSRRSTPPPPTPPPSSLSSSKKRVVTPTLEQNCTTPPSPSNPTISSTSSTPHHQHHHPHFSHHLGGKRMSPYHESHHHQVASSSSPTPSSPPSSSSSSPPKHCSSRRVTTQQHRSDSSSDDGCCGGGSNNSNVATSTQQFPIVVVTETSTQQQTKSSTSKTTQNNNVLLKPSPSYELVNGDDDDDVENVNSKKSKKKRILFLSWFFKRSGGGKVDSKNKSSSPQQQQQDGMSLANGIYKTRSCAELKVRGVGGNKSDNNVSTRECFGVVTTATSSSSGGGGGGLLRNIKF